MPRMEEMFEELPGVTVNHPTRRSSLQLDDFFRMRGSTFSETAPSQQDVGGADSNSETRRRRHTTVDETQRRTTVDETQRHPTVDATQRYTITGTGVSTNAVDRRQSEPPTLGATEDAASKTTNRIRWWTAINGVEQGNVDGAGQQGSSYSSRRGNTDRRVSDATGRRGSRPSKAGIFPSIQNLQRKQSRRSSILTEDQRRSSFDVRRNSTATNDSEEQKAVKESRQEKTRKQEADKKQQQQAQQLANQTNFYSCERGQHLASSVSVARQLKTVNYALSSDKCMEEGWTIRPLSPVPTPEPAKELFQQISNSNIVSAHRYHKNFVEKRYDNGEMFLVVFENGTGNVWYHSGNLAISIVSSERSGRVVFIVYEDASRDENPRMQAMFKPDGYCTCYYRNGKIRVNLTPFGGEYYSKEGERLKKWEWRDRETHVHAPPFQPITFALSKQIGVRIIAQEGVYLTFIDGKRSARFNVGTKLRLLQHGSRLEPIDTHRRELQATRLYIHSLMEHMDNLAKFPKSPRMVARMKPHRYLRSRSLVDKTFLNLPSTERAADLQRQSLPQLVRVPHRLSENAKIKKGRTFKATSSSVAAAGGFRLLDRESAARKSKADTKTVAVVVN